MFFFTHNSRVSKHFDGLVFVDSRIRVCHSRFRWGYSRIRDVYSRIQRPILHFDPSILDFTQIRRAKVPGTQTFMIVCVPGTINYWYCSIFLI